VRTSSLPTWDLTHVISQLPRRPVIGDPSQKRGKEKEGEGGREKKKKKGGKEEICLFFYFYPLNLFKNFYFFSEPVSQVGREKEEKREKRERKEKKKEKRGRASLLLTYVLPHERRAFDGRQKRRKEGRGGGEEKKGKP